jgi:uncharacterized membrane protein
MSTDTPHAAPAASPATDDKTVAIVCYLHLIGFIIAIVIHNGKKTKLGSYHLRQALGFIVTSFALGFILIIPILGWIVGFCGFLFLVVLWIMAFISAIKGEMKPVPVLGEYYQKWFGNAFD